MTSYFEQSTLKINAPKPVAYNERAVREQVETVGIIAQEKLDGIRYHLVITPGADLNGYPTARGQFLSRSHKVIPSLAGMFSTEEEQLALGAYLAESLYPNGLVVDGEAMVKGMTFQASSGRLRSKAHLKASELNLYVYGIMSLAELLADTKADITATNSLMEMHVEVGVAQLQEFLKEFTWLRPQTTDIYTMEDLQTLYNHVRDNGGEGLVLKAMMEPLKRGKKVGWWKMKPDDTIDGKVVGINWGTEGLANEGKIIGFQVELESGVVVDANNISQALMDEFTKAWDDANGPDRTAEVVNPYEGWYCQVKFMEMTEDGSLRHPSFDCWRGTETDPTEKA